jgi:hypothetical protein
MLNPNDKMMIMVGSSSKKLFKKSISNDTKGDPLAGVSHDMKGLSLKYINEPHKEKMVTSKHQDTLLSKKFILNTLKNKF